MRAALFGTVAVVGGFLVYSSTVSTTVDEEIVRGAPASQAAAGPQTGDGALADAPTAEEAVVDRGGDAAEPTARAEKRRVKPEAKATPDATPEAVSTPRPATTPKAPKVTATPKPEATPKAAAKPAPKPSGPVEVSAGKVRSLGHAADGRAALVELSEGRRVITLEDFFVDPGPKVEVWLVAGPVNGDGDARDPIKLGGLKGSKGDQQYTVPKGAKLPNKLSVVIWCVPFTTVLAAADLKSS